MILTSQELFDAIENPRINTISLELLCEYYETYLNPHIYKYEIKNESEEESEGRTIELMFDKENFCHLIGIESIVRRNVKKVDEYKGLKGWENAKQSVCTFNELKRLNKRGFNDNKSRFVFFYLIPKLVESPKGVLFNPSKVATNTRIDCEILFHDEHQNANIHIGIKFDEELGYYIPKTFLIKKNKGIKYIENQIVNKSL